MPPLLWDTEQHQTWLDHLESLQARVQQVDKPLSEPSLLELDRWMSSELPAAVKDRQEAGLDKDEVVRLVEWKLKRGKWRPKLLDYAKDADAHAVQATIKAAFAMIQADATEQEPTIQNAEEALKKLTTLKGIGAATASAMLAVLHPSLPFMSDEAAAAVLPASPKYTVPEWRQVAEVLRQKATSLSSSSGTQWTAVQVERALWSEALQKQLSKPKPQGTKRKR